MEKPTITIQDDIITIGPVKARVWREAAKIKDIPKGAIIDPGMMIDFIVKAFNTPAVTVDSVEDSLNLDEIYPLFLKVYSYVLGLVTAGLAAVEAPKKNGESI